jgi:hypothetical protein
MRLWRVPVTVRCLAEGCGKDQSPSDCIFLISGLEMQSAESRNCPNTKRADWQVELSYLETP